MENGKITPFEVSAYDEEIKKTLPFYEEIYQQIVDIVRLWNVRQIEWLDVGCGTGKMARTALESLDIHKIVCIDVDEEMIEKAKVMCNSEKTNFLLGDVRELPYKNAFDIVSTVQVCHYLKAWERMDAVKSCYHALKDNGIYISFENFAPDSEDGKNLYLERWKRFQIAAGKSEKDADLHIGRYGREYFPITISEQISILKECGFRTVEILWVSYMQVGILARK